ncbi:FecR domain-containing protein [Herbaspirillum rubrisubalbicans]|uniref:Iron dicitrate transport regulator FecR n=1 Tax=Herbaspirillum rubrisubalbicans Os34 TaxID=1235827 RepID=A0A6M3ZUK8_9BURK|nr:FecR domain-containing protein [Herbaspirillum rubrisubalbicans]QJQ01202.1 iron dicitrate transport regulator FecR [Herbaspirillum rubrisubalbicans Os34]
MKRSSRVEAEATDWLARRDRDDWSSSQQESLDAWLNDATENRIAYLRMERTWSRADRLVTMKRPGQMSVPPQKGFWDRRTVLRLAASVMLASSVAMLAFNHLVNNDYVTAVGQRTSLALADGSHVMLNTSTRLQYEPTQGLRLVRLKSGEAYFEVAHDASHPFVIEAGANRVTVLGTKFSVRRDGDHLQVAVVQGRVQVSSQSPGQPMRQIVLTRNESAVVDNGLITMSEKTPQSIEHQLSWRQGKLVLDQMTLAQAASEFNRYNKKKIIINDPLAAQIRIGGSFNVDNVDGFVRLLQSGFGLTVQETGNEIKIGVAHTG